MYQENIHVLASLRFLDLNLEWQNIKLGRKTYEDLFFLFHENMFYVTIMQSDNTVVSIAVAFFNSGRYYNSYKWSKNITPTVK